MFKSILLPVDVHHESSWKHTVPMAVKLAEIGGATLHVLAIVPDFGSSMVATYFPPDFEKNALAKAKTDIQEFVAKHVPATITSKIHVGHGKIYHEIIRFADSQGADLIIMGSRHKDHGFLIGSNAERVSRHAKQNILIVRD